VVDVEDDARAEGWHIEFVDLLLGHLIIVGLEKVGGGVRAQQEGDAPGNVFVFVFLFLFFVKAGGAVWPGRHGKERGTHNPGTQP
jgi:hypothetical protein